MIVHGLKHSAYAHGAIFHASLEEVAHPDVATARISVFEEITPLTQQFNHATHISDGTKIYLFQDRDNQLLGFKSTPSTAKIEIQDLENLGTVTVHQTMDAALRATGWAPPRAGMTHNVV